MSRHDFSFENLSELYRSTPPAPLDSSQKIVIFSDLHLGDGKRTDDFRVNAELFATVLDSYYYEGGYRLILNGDVEELQRFRLEDIMRRWGDVYALFDRFKAEDRFHRLVGNHDLDLLDRTDHPFEVEEALRYSYHGNSIFIFHGHQTTVRFEKFNKLVGFGLRWVANPLKIKNYSVSHDSLKRFRTEERVYDFASAHKVLSIIGHTHRPLFESMSKVDSLKFEIERLCRKYPKASPKKQAKIERTIDGYRSELEQIDIEEDPTAEVASLYNANLVIPCMFNSGTVVGKRGMTCLEIGDGRISLVHWFDDRRSNKYIRYANYETDQLENTDFHRVEVKSESLDYIFTRIRLLTGAIDVGATGR
ncbi:MAG: metallophosphoesterase [Spirochaetota bacterium]